MDENQTVLPPSFVALYVPEGRIKPTEPWPLIAQRYDLCEDMAQMLTEHAAQLQARLDAGAPQVLARIGQALLDEEARLSEPEVGWVLRRLAELLRWDAPASPDAATARP